MTFGIVNGVRSTETKIETGDRIKIGDVVPWQRGRCSEARDARGRTWQCL
jgi:hypothetical protein